MSLYSLYVKLKRFSGTVLVSDDADTDGAERFDLYISSSKIENYIENGCLYVSDKDNLFAVADGVMKNKILYYLEGKIESEAVYSKKISVVICTYMRGEKLIDAVWSVIRQSLGKDEYEIIIVDNAPFESKIDEEIKWFENRYSDIKGFIKYISAPQKGLSHARNVGMWEAVGEYILFIDDDALADNIFIEL